MACDTIGREDGGGRGAPAAPVRAVPPAGEAAGDRAPGGLAGDLPDHADEALAVAAGRELVEETGYEADRMSPLTAGPPSAGLSSEVVTFLRADGLRRVGPGSGEAGEDITVHEVDPATVASWLGAREAAGVLVDAKAYAGLYFVARSA